MSKGEIMKARAFRFGRLSSSQFNDKLKELNDFLAEQDVIGTPVMTSNDEEGTVLFVFFNEKEAPKLKEQKKEK